MAKNVAKNHLGLEVSEAAELCGVQKRSFNYWEQGERGIPEDVEMKFFTMSSHYSLILENKLAHRRLTLVSSLCI